ncbi:hypothetical protein PT300_08040 [Enterobacteriaceae bacterium ESL0689]|nr:hypothetical protein [Enterobacteriaceae bacterium ESL0689]
MRYEKDIIFLAFISFYSMANFSGHWVNENDSQSLTLDLVEDGAHLTGNYCFITNNGNRIDCSEGNDRNINGIIKNNIGVVDFESTFGGIGQATISIERDMLKYTITNSTPFVNANMFVSEVILFKKSVQVSVKESSAHKKYDADIIIRSATGGSLIFSQKKSGGHYDENSHGNAWGKIVFSSKNYSADLSWDDRYYVENGSSELSPSGRYLIVISVSGGFVEFGDGTSEYKDRAYCSVVDMSNGCIVSDWDGWACSYTWTGGKDVLASSEEADADIFDFKSARPAINKMISKLSLLDTTEARNMLRCDAPSRENINKYQQLARENKDNRKIVQNAILSFLYNCKEESLINKKASLFSAPDNSSQTKSYLIPGDVFNVFISSQT